MDNLQNLKYNIKNASKENTRVADDIYLSRNLLPVLFLGKSKKGDSPGGWKTSKCPPENT